MVTYEAIADLLWSDRTCPTHVLYAALEVILKSAVDRGHVGPDKFSRWLRALCSILLSRGRQSDRSAAQGYTEQALLVMEEDAANPQYPIDEKHWLLVFCNNAGVEAMQTSRLEEAEIWFRLATGIARFLPNHEDAARKVQKSYNELLNRFGDGQAASNAFNP